MDIEQAEVTLQEYFVVLYTLVLDCFLKPVYKGIIILLDNSIATVMVIVDFTYSALSSFDSQAKIIAERTFLEIWPVRSTCLERASRILMPSELGTGNGVFCALPVNYGLRVKQNLVSSLSVSSNI